MKSLKEGSQSISSPLLRDGFRMREGGSQLAWDGMELLAYIMLSSPRSQQTRVEAGSYSLERYF
eukprot:scaffold13340_cov212-Alexandrium_tamarense.AAC.4